MKTLLSLVLVGMMASVVQADTITFSGRDWATRVGGGNAYGTVPTYVVNAADSATGTGAWSDAAMMYTDLSVSVGDVVSYTVTSTMELRNTSGAALSDYIGDMWTGFIGGTVADLETFAYVTETKDVFYEAVDRTYTWTFTSDTTADVEIMDNVTSTTTTVGKTLSTAVSGITGFAVANWDTEQDTTLADFVYTAIPEPATILLLAVGGSLLLFRRPRG